MRRTLSGSMIAAFIFVTGGEALACCVEQFRNTDTLHGLYEIRQEAVRFLDAHNKTTGEDWQALDPNLKVVAPRCDVALTVQWLPKSHGASGDNVVVTVRNPKTGAIREDGPFSCRRQK